MHYFEEMFNNKYGFSDGEALPPDAEQVREVYIRAINAYAEHLSSSQGLVAYDRFGIHNPSLILLYNKRDLDEAGIESAAYHRHTDISANPLELFEADDAMEAAVGAASLMGLDEFVFTEVHIDEGFTIFLSDLSEGRWTDK